MRAGRRGRTVLPFAALAPILLPLARFARLRAIHAAARVVETAVDPGTLQLPDRFELRRDVVHHGVHVVLRELLFALLLQAIEQLLHAGHPPVELALIAIPHHLAERVRQVAIGDQIVRQRLHQFIGVEREDLLRAVPATVDIAVHHRVTLLSDKLASDDRMITAETQRRREREKRDSRFRFSSSPSVSLRLCGDRSRR